MVASQIIKIRDVGAIGTFVLGSMIFIIGKVLLAALYFIPSFIIYTFVFNKFKNIKISQVMVKFVLTMLALITMMITLFILYGKNAFRYNDFFGINFALFDVLSIFLSGFLYKISWDENKAIGKALM